MGNLIQSIISFQNICYRIGSYQKYVSIFLSFKLGGISNNGELCYNEYWG